MKIPKPSTSSVLRWQAWQWKGYESHGSGWYYQPGAVEKRRRRKKRKSIWRKKTENKEICLYKLPQILQRCDSGLCTAQNSSPVHHHHHGSDGCNDADFSGRVLLCFCAAVLTGHALSSSAGVQQVQRGTGELEHACFFPIFVTCRRVEASVLLQKFVNFEWVVQLWHCCTYQTWLVAFHFEGLCSVCFLHSFCCYNRPQRPLKHTRTHVHTVVHNSPLYRADFRVCSRINTLLIVA